MKYIKAFFLWPGTERNGYSWFPWWLLLLRAPFALIFIIGKMLVFVGEVVCFGIDEAKEDWDSWI